jgi:methylated-DNA-[protein]-cysteine S-methyltransferase
MIAKLSSRTLLNTTMVEREYVYKMVDSPIGKLKLVASDVGLAATLWENDRPGRVRVKIIRREDQQAAIDATLALAG